jgi:hypothetical protein
MLIVLFVEPFIPLLIFHFATSQMYFYGLFEDITIPLILNILIFLGTTIIAIISVTIIPIAYTNKALIKYNEKENEISMDVNMEYINPIKLLLKIIKLKNEMKKGTNVA